MGFLLKCPNCGLRSAYEFIFGGELKERPKVNDNDLKWINFVYLQDNPAGLRIEWIYHRYGCKRWFLAERDTLTNKVFKTYLARG